MSDTTDSERLDGEVLGEQVGDDTLPGTAGFPPDHALGVNDPNLVAPDDVAMREARTRSEEATAASEAESIDLLPPDGDDDHRDHEQQAVATRGVDRDAAAPAEVAAVHVENDGPGEPG